jgi:glycogen operon protein
MTDADWGTGYARSLAVFLNGDAITEPGPRGEAVRDESFLLMFNADREALTFTLPGSEFGDDWEVLIDTGAWPAGAVVSAQPRQQVELAGRSIMVLRGPGGEPALRRPAGSADRSVPGS